jgi:hypothetical protein
MSYVIGNWTVESLTADSISTPKSLSITDLSYATDYTATEKGPNEVKLANTTGGSLVSPEQLRYARSRVSNIYANVDVPETMKCNVRTGVRTLHEVKYLMKATNSVSGQEILLPLRGWICLEVPTVDFITPAAIESLLKRTVATAFATGSVDGALVTDVARGDLDPTA